MNTKYVKDLAERVAFTAIEAGAAYAATQLAGLPEWLAVPIAAGLALIKGWAAKSIGNSDSASVSKAV